MLVGSLVYPTHITQITEPHKLCRGCISSLRTSVLDSFSLLPHSDPSSVVLDQVVLERNT